MSCAGIGDAGQYFVHLQGNSAVYIDSNQQVLQHGCAGSTPNLAAYQHTGNHGYQSDPSGRPGSFSTSIQRASLPGNFALQQQPQPQPQPVVGLQSTGVSYGMGDVMFGTSPCAGGMHVTQQQQIGNPGVFSGMPGGLHTVLGVQGVAATDQKYKLQLLAQLQAQITQQQQELQQELQQEFQYQHQAAGVLHNSAGTFGPSAAARVGTNAVAARLSAPGCMGAAHDDVRLGRDQARVLIARASAAGHIPMGANHAEHLFPAPSSVLQPQQLQQQQPIMMQQQSIMLQQARVQQQQQQDAMSPCAFSNTPTALAALPPGLLAELVGVDAAASVISRHWSANSKGPGVSNSCSSSTPKAGVSSSSGHCVSSSTPRGEASWASHASSSMPGYADVSSVALHQQLQLATDQLANLHISGTAGSTGPLSGPVLHSNGSKGWDWASVGEVLRTDSSASKSSVRRADSGLASETSIGSNIWGDGGGCHVVGSAVAPHALNLAPCIATGALSQTPSLSQQAVQRTSSSDSSCASHASDGGLALRASLATARPSLAHSSNGGPDSSSNATVQMPPGTVAGAAAAAEAAAAAAEAAAAAAEAARGLPAAVPRAAACVAGQSSVQPAAQGRSVDTLLRDCAPKWAKAGWNPRSAVAAAPDAAARGTGAFVRRSSSGTAPSGAAAAPAAAAAAVDSKPGVSAPIKKGTGAFIPPAVRAAVAAASGLGPK